VPLSSLLRKQLRIKLINLFEGDNTVLLELTVFDYKHIMTNI